MTENEFLLEDRLGVIRDTITKYGEENFYLSFSGGKDSTVVHYLLDMALPNNKIPRVFSNTGIEYNAIVEFVRERERERTKDSFRSFQGKTSNRCLNELAIHSKARNIHREFTSGITVVRADRL